VDVELFVEPVDVPRILPRLGICMSLDETLERFEYFGRGPHENYVDRKTSAALGRYSSTVTDQYVPYVKPQETGNREEVRWAALSNASGRGVLMVGSSPLSVSALHFTASDLAEAKHTLLTRSSHFQYLEIRNSLRKKRRNVVAPRIPIPRDEDLPPEIREYINKVRQANRGAINLSNMLCNVPASIKEFNAMGSTILFKSELEARKREIAVLRIAHITGAAYEWHHHRRLGISVGITEEEIAKIIVDGPVTGLDEQGNLLCRVADEITLDIRLSDEALSMALDIYGPRQTTELILCCCWFNLVSRFLESTGIEIEDPEG